MMTTIVSSPAAAARLLVLSLAFFPGTAFAHPDPGTLAAMAFAEAPGIVDCTLEDGTAAHCRELTVSPCPRV